MNLSVFRPACLIIMTACFTLTIGQSAASAGQIATSAQERLKQKIADRKSGDTGKARLVTTRNGYAVYALRHDGIERRYMVHVPRKYNPRKPVPLLLALHGGGGDMEYMAKDKFYGLTPKADKEGFIVVYPNGYSGLKSGKLATWNGGECCGAARDKNIDDVGFLKKVVENVSAQWNIDRERIFATGMSNGGIMAHRLACELPDIFKGVAPVAGTDNTKACSPSRPVSVLTIHALDDTHVLYNGGAGKDVFRNPDMVTEFTSVPETVDRWVRRNNCRNESRRILSVEGAYCDLYDGCADGARVEVCTTTTGGHSWPGGYKPAGRADTPPSQAISANDVMWNFFMSLPPSTTPRGVAR